MTTTFAEMAHDAFHDRATWMPRSVEIWVHRDGEDHLVDSYGTLHMAEIMLKRFGVVFDYMAFSIASELPLGHPAVRSG